MAGSKIDTEINRLLNESKEEVRNGNFESGWQKLAEAHIISQPFAKPHTVVHGHMLLLALSQKNFKEVIGQLTRLLIAAPGSILHVYPVGNSGRSDVSMFLPQEIPAELKRKIEQLNK